MDRGTTPVVGVTLLVAITVVAATAVGLAATATPGASPPVASVETTADADRNEITISHRGGDTLDIDEVTVDVTVDGEPLARQPPVPFFAATGFRGGPTGPFNPASSSEFGAGDEASFRLATTNEPLLSPGDRIAVELRTEEGVVARSSTVAQ